MDGQFLVIHPMMLTPTALNEDKCSRRSPFPITRIDGGKLCAVVIDSGST